MTSTTTSTISSTTRRLVWSSVFVLLVAGFGVLAAAPAGADDVLELDASIDGRSVEGAGSSDPIILDPNEDIIVELVVDNPTSSDIVVARVRLEGQAMGLTFLVYDTGTSFRIGAGATRTVELPLDFFDLEDAATGYLSSSLKLYDVDREQLAGVDFVVDVKGKATSTLGLFALFALIFTLIALGVLLYAVFRGRLSANRALRGAQFVLVGIGTGLCLALGLAVLRIVAVPATASVALIVLPTLGAFVLGYVMPGALGRWVDDEDHDDELDAAMAAD